MAIRARRAGHDGIFHISINRICAYVHRRACRDYQASNVCGMFGYLHHFRVAAMRYTYANPMQGAVAMAMAMPFTPWWFWANAMVVLDQHMYDVKYNALCNEHQARTGVDLRH
jgi:hypothetical protein